MYDEVIDSNNPVAISPKSNPVRWLFSVYCISTALVINKVYEASELGVENLMIYSLKKILPDSANCDKPAQDRQRCLKIYLVASRLFRDHIWLLAFWQWCIISWLTGCLRLPAFQIPSVDSEFSDLWARRVLRAWPCFWDEGTPIKVWSFLLFYFWHVSSNTWSLHSKGNFSNHYSNCSCDPVSSLSLYLSFYHFHNLSSLLPNLYVY